jgi:DNA-binding CsgD family transcriptional regulator
MVAASELSERDARMVLSVAHDLAGCRDGTDLAQQVQELPELIGADSVLLAGVSSRERSLLVEAGDRDVYRTEMVEAVVRNWQEHPVVVADVNAPGRGVRRLSDFVGREWQRRDLFNEFYRPLGMTRELSLQLSWEPDGSSLCFVLHRAGSDFRERERAVMEHLSPHLQAARSRIAAEGLLGERLDLLERGLENERRAALVVGRDGRLVTANRSGREALRRWFGTAQGTAALPEPLREWWIAARAGPAPAEFELRAGDGLLRAQLIAGAEEDLIVLGEGDGAPSPERLARALPITRREAEVLARLAAGRTNDGIAYDLGISRHTVVRHVERIYLKLGTHTRAAATRAALLAVDRGS